MIPEAEKVWQLGLFATQAYDAKSVSFTDYYSSDTFNLGLGITEWGRPIVACAGSNDARDFIDDVTAIPFYMPELGVTMHFGFTEGYQDAWAWLKPKIPQGAAFVGHSLGSPHASLMAVMAAKAGLPVDMLVMLETPRPGYQGYADLVNSIIKTIYSFSNARDPVVDVPLHILLWRHIRETMIELNNQAPGIDPFDDHMLAAVMPGLMKWRDTQLGKI
jgi:pimeloyl-ACP methyl ester carboxylesterase